MSESDALQKEAILDELQAQQIPLKLMLAANEVSAPTAPPAIYAMASRHSYLPCVAMQVHGHFQEFLPPGDNTPWFDFKGVPLKWHIPIGALYDLTHTGTADSLPWTLTVHYRGLPESYLLRCEGESSVKDSFINSLKEAAFVLTGSAAGVMSAGPIRDTLWAAVSEGRIKEFRSAVKSLNIEPALRGEKRTRTPVKLLVSRIPRGAQWSWEFVKTTSKPIDAAQPEFCATLRDALAELLPQEFIDAPNESRRATGLGAEGAAEDASVGKGGQAEEELQSGAITTPKAMPSNMRVMVAGVEPPLETPLVWLHANLRHPDHFLYIVVHISEIC